MKISLDRFPRNYKTKQMDQMIPQLNNSLNLQKKVIWCFSMLLTKFVQNSTLEKLFLIEQKGMTFDQDFGFSPLFLYPSKKKREEEKEHE